MEQLLLNNPWLETAYFASSGLACLYVATRWSNKNLLEQTFKMGWFTLAFFGAMLALT